jgi:hypothetical protein
MNAVDRNQLDPIKIIVGVLATRGDSDLLVGVVNSAGIRVNLTMLEQQDYSHKTRIRALLPRIFAAYDELTSEAQLATAIVALRNFSPSYPDTKARAVEALVLAGWRVEGDRLEVTSPELREMFFPRGSPWDAPVVLRGIFNEAKTTLIIIDSYTDGTAFQMLASRPLAGLTVRILCGASSPAVAAEARTFIAQHPGVTGEVRQSKDFHDRFVIIDDHTCVHIGASIQDAGKTAFMVSRVEDAANKDAILGALAAAW